MSKKRRRQPYDYSLAETLQDNAVLARLTLGTQTVGSRREIIEGLDVPTLMRLLKRFQNWEERFQDGAINSVLIREAIQNREHAKQSLKESIDHETCFSGWYGRQ